MNTMHSRLKLRFVFSLLCVSIAYANLINGTTINTLNPNMVNDSEIIKSPNQLVYQPHDSIFISNDGDFTSQGFPGSGTQNDPYIIEGYRISGSSGDLIYVRHTTSYFIIRNNILDGSKVAIRGIFFFNVTFAIIENNIIYDNTVQQIEIDASRYNTIATNNISGGNSGSNGILLVDRSNQGNSGYNLVLNNLVQDNRDHGISLESSQYNHIEGNSVSNNGDGIQLSETHNNVIWNNDLSSNTNHINDNGFNNSIENNYYDDWLGIGSYDIAGSAGNQDASPRVTPKIPWMPLVYDYDFYDDFEYGIDIANFGYNINQTGSGWGADTYSDLSMSGSRSLQVNSQPCGTTFVTKDLNIAYSTDLMLSLWVWWWNGEGNDFLPGVEFFSGAFRIYLESDDSSIALGYGDSDIAQWESNQTFDVGVIFPVGQWYNLERSLQTDIDSALNHSNTPIISFSPNRVSKIEFFSHEGEQFCENFFDDVKIGRAITTSGFEGETTTLTAEPQTTSTIFRTTESTQNSGLDEVGIFVILLVAIVGGGVLYYRRKPTVLRSREDRRSFVREQEIDLPARNIPITVCRGCGSPTTEQDVYCGECGTRV